MFYNMNLDKDGIPALSYRKNRLVRRANNFKWYVYFSNTYYKK